MAKMKAKVTVETLVHEDQTRYNIPTAEMAPVVQDAVRSPVRVAYERRNRDLDPQLVWRGKDEQDWSDLVVHAPPLYIQEKVHPKVLIDDLLRQSSKARSASEGPKEHQLSLFADFNGVPEGDAKTEFYQHDANWTNRMILGDSLQVMASLAEREGLRGKVQCIYLDPPYGIKFNSNFQWSTTSRDVKDGNAAHITREPEQVKAFRDTWRDGIHSYLTYLRDRLTVARDLLTDSGSIFVQIGDENVHRVRTVMDEVFGDGNFVSLICYRTTTGRGANLLDNNIDYLIWFARDISKTKFRDLIRVDDDREYRYVDDGSGRGLEFKKPAREAAKGEVPYNLDNFTSQGESVGGSDPIELHGKKVPCPSGRHWRVADGRDRLMKADRLELYGKQVRCRVTANDGTLSSIGNYWHDVLIGSFVSQKVYVVQTSQAVVERAIQIATDPGDLVLDPTCGSGTTAYVAEQWGRRWITIDTSRVALALARARIMGARYSYYLLADSPEGQQKEAETKRTEPSKAPTHGNIRQGFVYERVPHITLKSIANNAEIDVIWEKHQANLEPLREKLNKALKQKWEEWEIPREADDKWSAAAKKLHADWWKQRIARQKEIDASIAAKADHEYLYDKPYEDKKKVRVAGPFTVESLSPHRMLGIDENDELVDGGQSLVAGEKQDFAPMILENLKTSGVQQAHKEDRITFTSLVPWPGDMVCAEGHYQEGNNERRAAIFIGPEFGTVQRQDLVAAAREAGDANFDVLIACAFNFEAHATEFNKLGRIPVLKARMNADLHMAADLKNTGKGKLFVIFGEPDIEILPDRDGELRVKVNGVDVFHPNTGEVRSDGPDGIACWFLDTDYNEESFFVRHAYFLGANDPYKSLKTTLKAEINADAWETLNSDTSRPFEKPESGRIAVKVINHLGDEVMKVFRVKEVLE